MDDLLAEFERPRQENPEDKERRRRLFAAVGIAALSLVALGSLTTNALFSDTENTDSSAFVTGTIDLVTNPAAPATVDFSAGNMAPGDTVYGALRVRNAGSLGLRYAMSATADNGDSKGLRNQLDFAVYRGVTATDCNNGDVSAGTSVAASSPIGASRQLTGNPATGNQAGDRALSAAAADDLCVVADLPLATGNAYQNSTTTVTFQFDAEQTKNNP